MSQYDTKKQVFKIFLETMKIMCYTRLKGGFEWKIFILHWYQ